MDASPIPRSKTLSRPSSGLVHTWLAALLVLATVLFTMSAQAAVDLRVESRPITGPIDAYVTVTDAGGNPVPNLTAGSFTVTLDGQPVTILPSGFGQPPSANPARNVSVVFVMDYTPSTEDQRATIQNAVISFINSMNVGDYAAIVKFNWSNPAKASVVQPFTRIDGGAGTSTLLASVTSPYPGYNSNVYDGIAAGLDQFASPPAGVTLPDGPKAVIVLSDGVDNASSATLNSVISMSSSLGVPLFTIAVASDSPNATQGRQRMESLAARTGGNYISAPTEAEVTAAYSTLASRLDNGYLLSFASSINDCDQHTLQVTVTGQAPVSKAFTRCDALQVPNVVGLTQANATTTITGAGLTVGTITQQTSSTVAAGRVISQGPSSGTSLPAGSAVNLVVSTGGAQGTVPDVVDLTHAAAVAAITGAGLTVGTVTQQANATVPSGRVISQNPAAGASLSTGAAVNLVVSTGPAQGTVPDVAGLTESEATTAIEGAGLVVGTVTQQASSTVPAGRVFSQNPVSGASVSSGSGVNLVVSTGPAQGTVPNVFGMTQAAATTAITDAGLVVGTVTQQSNATVASGSVASQSPASGTTLAAGSSVNLVVSTGPAPTPPPSGGGGGGGGGALGLLELLVGLAVLVPQRRRRPALRA